jgi:sugar/nucleoside kinase (ribokinase family)
MQSGGKISHKDWAAKDQYLKYFDLFKVDDKEATVLTGEKDMKRAMKILHEKGAKMVNPASSDHTS